MKKLVVIVTFCGLLAYFATGCADMAENRRESGADKEIAVDSIQAAGMVNLMEEGYYMVEGSLCEIGKNELFLETEDGQILYFKLAPETIIYAGENKEISEGQTVKVVFDGNLNGSELEKVSVIAVTVQEEKL